MKNEMTMIWKQALGGTALFLNGKLVGWVTSTINGRYLFGVCGQNSNTKEVADSRHEAMIRLLNAIGE